MDFDKKNNEPVLLPQNLEKWSERHLLNIMAQQFHNWLHKRKTLVLLAGLDEISSKEQRQKVCRWIKDMGNGLKNACFFNQEDNKAVRDLAAVPRLLQIMAIIWKETGIPTQDPVRIVRYSIELFTGIP